MIKGLLLVVLNLALFYSANAQSSAETLRYLNDKLNSDASESTQIQGQKIVWSTTPDGKLITKLIHRDGYTLDTKSYYLKALCNNPSCTSIETFPDLLNPTTGHPVTYLVFTTTSSERLVIALNSKESANRIKNAVFRLVTLAKANKTYTAKDPFDY